MTFINPSFSVSILPGNSVGPKLSQTEKVSSETDYGKKLVHRISPMERTLLQDDHLETWRNLRTIEEVLMQNRYGPTFQKRVKYYMDPILKECPFQITPDPLTTSTKTRVKPEDKLPFQLLVYHLIQIMKGHSERTEHSKLDFLEEEILTTFKHVSKEKETNSQRILVEFVGFVMSKIGWHLLIENIQKSKILEYGLKNLPQSDHLSGEMKFNSKDQVRYGAYYRDYMHIFEVFELLVFDGLQNKKMISGLAKIQGKYDKESKIERLHLGDYLGIHRYLIARRPWDGKIWSPAPFLGDPFKKYGQNSHQLSDKIHKIWFQFGESDYKISVQLGAILQDGLAGDYKVHKTLKTLHRSEIFKNVRHNNKNNYNLAMNHMSKVIDLISSIYKDNHASRSILHEILSCSIDLISEKRDYNAVKASINNGVMFYLFIRRIGHVLKHVEENLSGDSSLESKPTNSQFMGYHWALARFRSKQRSKAQSTRWKWLSFDLGKAYQDHLLASAKIHFLHDQMVPHAKSKEGEQTKSTDISKTATDWDKSEALDFENKIERQSKLLQNGSQSPKYFFQGQDVLNDGYHILKRKAFAELEELHSTGKLYECFGLGNQSRRKKQGGPIINVSKKLKQKSKKNFKSKRPFQKKMKLLTIVSNQDKMKSNGSSNKPMARTSDRFLKDKQGLGASAKNLRTGLSKYKDINKFFTHDKESLQEIKDATFASPPISEDDATFQESSDYTPKPSMSPQKRKSSMNTNSYHSSFFDGGWPKKSRTKTIYIYSPSEFQEPDSFKRLDKGPNSGFLSKIYISLNNEGMHVSTGFSATTSNSNSFKAAAHTTNKSPVQTPKDPIIEKAHLFDLNKAPELSVAEQGSTKQAHSDTSIINLDGVDSLWNKSLPDLNHPIEMTDCD
ncbi:uncharacterized protein MELLADRAFT_64039 [Melampsora larici-populina 98AG31]|uniref:Uncharacterized protein n=1 Tax=Melampsora larici-populina (strain 98AG31 / pathotype 3-4-7) TaxID=747676 RepID=F4RPY5_MELLP|nr:uncharacterized protein MELLADRAFT_64039 [Melampsora larici-populina 98AG31]EGG05624.1 hypothetical protein MELLADRAFT_64039 [Melampsora larici-populina 98AG31]